MIRFLFSRSGYTRAYRGFTDMKFHASFPRDGYGTVRSAEVSEFGVLDVLHGGTLERVLSYRRTHGEAQDTPLHPLRGSGARQLGERRILEPSPCLPLNLVGTELNQPEWRMGFASKYSMIVVVGHMVMKSRFGKPTGCDSFGGKGFTGSS